MKISTRLYGPLLVALLMFGTTIFATFPTSLGGQEATSRSQSNPHDLSAQVTVFGNYSKDFREMEKTMQGQEFEVLVFLDRQATTAEDRMYAANAMLRMYDGIACNQDRVDAKRILKGQLDYYVWQMDSEATRTAGGLTFAKVPAASQTGLRMKDDLRAAKNKLEAIAASL
jgi:hypothetical protein